MLPELTLELVLLVGPAPHDVLERLLPHLAGHGRVDVEALELGAGGRAPGAHVDPTLGQEVEHRHRLRRAHRVVVGPGHEADAVAEPDVLGPRGDGAVEDLGVRAVRVLLQEVVLDGPEGVPAVLVAGDGLLQRVLVGDELAVLLPRTGDGDLVEQRELHCMASPGTVLPGTPGLERCTAPISPGRPGATIWRHHAWIGRPDLHRDGRCLGHRPRHGRATPRRGVPRRRGRSVGGAVGAGGRRSLDLRARRRGGRGVRGGAGAGGGGLRRQRRGPGQRGRRGRRRPGAHAPRRTNGPASSR